MGAPSVFPMGTTIFDPEKAWGGYTLIPMESLGAVLIDMNGKVVRFWKDFGGFPNKLLPGGYCMGSLATRDEQYSYQDMADLTQIDWDGNTVWSFTKREYIEDEGHDPAWMARQHHDYQREGNPVGYYVPGMEPRTDGGNTLILGHKTIRNKRISDKQLLDDVFYEVDWEGNIVWEWSVADHFKEFDFTDLQKNALFRNPNQHMTKNGELGDFMHVNSMSYLGPNKWYDAGDERFKPTNIIWDAREANICAITDKDTGKVVWQIGPNFGKTKEMRRIGQIIGQHHCHMIPRGLPGEGNILIFDNGGWAGYGAPDNQSRDGSKVERRDHSRVLEIDPTTLKVVWSFTGSENAEGLMGFCADTLFYSQLMSSAQRLPNGNTLITESCFNRLFEVTPDKEVVWEYIAPFAEDVKERNNIDETCIYRAYRYPYSYVPQVPAPEEVAVPRMASRGFRMPGAAEGFIDDAATTSVAGAQRFEVAMAGCVTDDQINDGEDEDEVLSAF